MNQAKHGNGTIGRVLIIDAPDNDGGTLKAGVALADRHDADVMVMTAIAPPANMQPLLAPLGVSGGEVWARLQRARHAQMAAKLKRLFPDRAIELKVVVGKPYMEITHTVMERDIDLVVKLAEELEASSDHVFASTDQHLLRKCPCTVWLRQPRGEQAHKNVLAAIDVDLDDAEEPETLHALNLDILRKAFDFAKHEGAQVHILHAWEPPNASLIASLFPENDLHQEEQYLAVNQAREAALQALLEQLAPLPDSLATKPVIHVRRGDPRAVITGAVDELQVAFLVMGTVARTGLQGVIIGNTAEDTQNSVARSLIAVKPAGFVSPLQ
jgi:nucleotide-binding universal stress UspA family protein